MDGGRGRHQCRPRTRGDTAIHVCALAVGPHSRPGQPDTSSVALDRLPGIDPAGYAGLEDGVDWHWDRILAGAALSTLLGVGAELAAPESRTDGNRIVIATREGAQDAVNQVGQEITKRNMSVQPTLTIRPGFPMRVMVSKDLVLRAYQPLFFQRESLQ